MKLFAAVLIAATLTVTVSAHKMPIPPIAPKKHFWTDKKVLVGEAIIIGSTLGLDAISTCQRIHLGTDKNPLIHSCGTAVAVEGAAAGFYTVLNYAEWHFGHDDPNKYWRFASYWSIPVTVCAIHCSAAIHNWDLPTHGERKFNEWMVKR